MKKQSLFSARQHLRELEHAVLAPRNLRHLNRRIRIEALVQYLRLPAHDIG